ncbi:MAG TPA: hypothetical protein VII52_03850 [Gemmatimonadaceae bacterium]
MMDELAHDLSVRELKALERRIRKDRIFAELAASYDEGQTTALEIARQAGISVKTGSGQSNPIPPPRQLVIA